MSAPNVTILRNTTNGHHKEYRVTVESNADGTFDVCFAYGRIGSTLKNGFKHKAVTSAQAHAAAAKLIAEKEARGYVLVAGPTAPNIQSPTTATPVIRRKSKKASLAQANAILSGLTSGRRKGFSIAL